MDIAGGITPDIVLRSKASLQNRIYIEVKLHAAIGGDTPLSQVTRQFLHLLATTTCKPSPEPDIRRAILLAAPPAWFEKSKNSEKWRYFREHYDDLARLQGIDITIGELRLDFLL